MEQNLNFDTQFMKERYFKLQDENLILKSKLLEIEKKYKPKENELEKKILDLRDENSKLQLQLKKNLESTRNLTLQNTELQIQMKKIFEKFENLEKNKEDNNFNYKEKYEKLNLENEQLKLDLSSMKEIIEDNKKSIKNLNYDKTILITQLQELHGNLINVLTPKLKMNENNIFNLQNEIEKISFQNQQLIEDNNNFFNKIQIQEKIIQTLTQQKKKLFSEINSIINRDNNILEGIEKQEFAPINIKNIILDSKNNITEIYNTFSNEEEEIYNMQSSINEPLSSERNNNYLKMSNNNSIKERTENIIKDSYEIQDIKEKIKNRYNYSYDKPFDENKTLIPNQSNEYSNYNNDNNENNNNNKITNSEYTYNEY